MFESGMSIVRADFHLHTRKDKEFIYSGEENAFVNQYVDALAAQEIKVGVITNHNKFDLDEYTAIRKKARKKEIFILPGVELSVKEGSNGVHTLIIFDPDTWIENGNNHIASLLSGAFAGISNYENENAKCKYDLSTVITELNAYGKDYFIVFAHVEQKSGILAECAGGLLESLVTQIPDFKERILGMQKMRTRDKIDNLNNWIGYLPAFVEGSDPKKISEVGKGESSYIKIGAYTFAAVKFALQDSQNRVYLKKPTNKHGYIESISFTGGKLDGKILQFSPALNTLIGIRGSGKSSVLEAIRYAFGIDPQTDEDYKKGVVKNLMGSGGIIQVNVADQNGHKYSVRRIYGQRPSVIDENGDDVGVQPQAVLGNMLYFGQKDLSSSGDHENDLLNRIVGAALSDQSVALAEIHRNMCDAIRMILDADELPSQIENIKAKINDTKHKIRIFEEKGVTGKLEKQLGFNNDVQQIKQLYNRLKTFLDKAKKAIKYGSSESEFFAYTSKFNEQKFNEAKRLLSLFFEGLDDAQKKIDELSNILNSIEGLQKELQEEMANLQEEFAAIKREISDETIDPDVCVKLSNSLQELESQLDSLQKKLGSQDSVKDKLRKLIRQRNELLREGFCELGREAKKINDSQSNLQITVEFKGDRSAFKDLLKTELKGTSITETKYQTISESDSFSDFVDLLADWILDDGKELQKILTSTEYSKAVDKMKISYEELIQEAIADKVEIYYHGKLLRQHSLGQRASALILFILTHNDTDVIMIDQPEDDLDNKVIYDEVLKVIREKKGNMQFVFATHNANIPVLGDADMILTAESDGSSITYQSGNIDAPDSQQQIITIMEGGSEAFSRRKLIYSAWNKC